MHSYPWQFCVEQYFGLQKGLHTKTVCDDADQKNTSVIFASYFEILKSISPLLSAHITPHNSASEWLYASKLWHRVWDDLAKCFGLHDNQLKSDEKLRVGKETFPFVWGALFSLALGDLNSKEKN